MSEQARQVERAGRRAADSPVLEWAARLGFIARGLMYLLIGFIAVQVAFGERGQADRGGTMGKLAGTGYGRVVLWVLAVGFLGIALWRLSEAAFGVSGAGEHQKSERLKSLARAVLYGSFCVSTVQLVTGSGSSATANSNSQSQELTARVMAHSGGRLLIGLGGLVLIAVAVFLAREALTREFLERMDLGGSSARTRSIVENLGVIGGTARAVVFALAGVLLFAAAVRFKPADAQGLDGTLRAFASTPLGPWLLVVVAVGLILFGVFSCCEARWRRI